LGTVTVGSLESGDGGFGVPTLEVLLVAVVVVVAVTEAAVGPPDGASSTPGAFELPPQAASPAASASGIKSFFIAADESSGPSM
jgi:hypothetical protein